MYYYYYIWLLAEGKKAPRARSRAKLGGQPPTALFARHRGMLTLSLALSLSLFLFLSLSLTLARSFSGSFCEENKTRNYYYYYYYHRYIVFCSRFGVCMPKQQQQQHPLSAAHPLRFFSDAGRCARFPRAHKTSRRARERERICGVCVCVYVGGLRAWEKWEMGVAKSAHSRARERARHGTARRDCVTGFCLGALHQRTGHISGFW